jgi:hypothetical protein
MTPLMTAAPCYREVGPLKLKLSLPPAGLIDRTRLHVFLEPTRNSKNSVRKAYIRADRVEDFVRGQGLAEGTEYIVSRTKRGSALSSTEFDIAIGSTVRAAAARGGERGARRARWGAAQPNLLAEGHPPRPADYLQLLPRARRLLCAQTWRSVTPQDSRGCGQPARQGGRRPLDQGRL